VTVAGKIAPGRRSTERTIFLISGTYTVRAGWSGDRSASKSVEASKGVAGTLEFRAPEVVVAPPPVAAAVTTEPAKPVDEDSQAKGKLPPTAFWVGVGLTATLAGVTLWSGVDTQNNPGPDRVREACNAGSPDCQSLYDQGLGKQHRTNALLGVTAGLGVATAVVGIFFTNWGGSKKSEPSAEAAQKAHRLQGFSIQPWVALGSGASVGALGRF